MKKPIVVLWLGAGQDSTALLFKFVFDEDFKKVYLGDAELLVIMSDTGNEFPDTYIYIGYLQKFCQAHGVEFRFITKEMGFHGNTWPSLQEQFERNMNVMGVTFNKTCTHNLKVKPCNDFLEDYLKKRYQFTSKGSKRVFYDYTKVYGKLTTIIGFAKGEESRMAISPQLEIFSDYNKKKDYRAVWVKQNIEQKYPLIDIGWSRTDCQEYIRSLGFIVPMPSNCMMCPFQNEAEIVYLAKLYPDMWDYWKQREQAKLMKFSGVENNFGVKGQLTLDQYLVKALKKYGHWSIDELTEYKFSHGHCVKSKY